MSVEDAESRRDERVRIAPAGPGDEAINAAIELGNAYRATLGLLPAAVYFEAAAKKWLLLAWAGDRLVGYALFAVTQRRIRLTHLCVDEGFRRRGVARALVDWISDHYHDSLGIRARSRRDYRLGGLWRSLEFVAESEGSGRGAAKRTITNWWRDHGHPKLFTRAADTVLVRASMDMNVLLDLVHEGRRDADESRAQKLAGKRSQRSSPRWRLTRGAMKLNCGVSGDSLKTSSPTCPSKTPKRTRAFRNWHVNMN